MNWEEFATKLMKIKGIVGVGRKDNIVVVYLISDDESVKNAVLQYVRSEGMPVEFRVTGPIVLLKE